MPGQTTFLTVVYISNVVLLALNATLLAVAYFKEQKLNSRLKDIDEEQNRIIEKTRIKSQELLVTTADKANELLKAVDFTTEQTKNAIEKNSEYLITQNQKTLTELTDKLTLENQKFARELHDGLNQTSRAKTSEVIDNASREIEKYSATIRSLIDSIHQETAAKVNSAWNKTQEEIHLYKESQLNKIDEGIADLIYRVAEDVLPQALSPQDHTQIIIKALEKAKQEGVLSM